jgi:hypothetical protein
MHDVDHVRFSLGGDIFDRFSAHPLTILGIAHYYGARNGKSRFPPRVLLSGGAGMAFGTPD